MKNKKLIAAAVFFVWVAFLAFKGLTKPPQPASSVPVYSIPASAVQSDTVQEVPVGPWEDKTGGPVYINDEAQVEYTIGEVQSPRLPAQLQTRPQTLPLHETLRLPAVDGGHSWQTVAVATGFPEEQLKAANPGYQSEELAYELRNGGTIGLVLDEAYELPWNDLMQPVRIAMTLENTDKMASVSLYQDFTAWVPAGLPEEAAIVLAEGMWYVEQGGNAPSEYIIGGGGDFVTVDGARFITYEAFRLYAERWFTPEWQQGWDYHIHADVTGRMRFRHPERGNNTSYITRLYTQPVTLEDGSIEFYQLVLQNDMVDWSKETVEPVYLERSRVLLQKTETGYRVAALEMVN